MFLRYFVFYFGFYNYCYWAWPKVSQKAPLYTTSINIHFFIRNKVFGFLQSFLRIGRKFTGNFLKGFLFLWDPGICIIQKSISFVHSQKKCDEICFLFFIINVLAYRNKYFALIVKENDDSLLECT